MTDVGPFIDAYVRPDDGTSVLICAHREYVRTAAHLFAACARRRFAALPQVIIFDEEELAAMEVKRAIDGARQCPHARRVAIIVCADNEMAFAPLLDDADPGELPVFRVSAGQPSIG